MKMIFKSISISLLLLPFVIKMVRSDLKIEVMKEGLIDLKTTILKPPNVTEFSGSAEEPYVGGTSGELLPFFPLDGCSALQEFVPFSIKDEKTGKLRFSNVNEKFDGSIVLISRGGCSFDEKFRNAKNVKGIIGVLIFNGPDDVLPANGKIELTNTETDLPGYLISNSLGLELYNKMIKYRGGLGGGAKEDSKNIKSQDSGNIPYIEITMTPVSMNGNNKANAVIQMALIAIIIILGISFGASIVFHMRSAQGPTNYSNNNDNQNQLQPIDVEFLQKLPLKTFKGRRKSTENSANTSGNSNTTKTTNYSVYQGGSTGSAGIKSPTVNDEKSLLSQKSSPNSSNSKIIENEWFEMIHHDWPINDSCPICLDEFNQNEVLNELPCGHCYHIACIQPWLQYRSSCCPLCKLDVREEFKPRIVPKPSVEDLTRSKLKNIWNKILLKTSKNGDSMNTSMTPPITSTTISMTELSQLSIIGNTHNNDFNTDSRIIPQVPQRALIQDSNDFQSVPL